MTYDEAAAILGPELTAQVDALVVAAGPLPQHTIDVLVPLLLQQSDVTVPERRVA